MTSVFRNTCLIVILSMVAMAGCAKHDATSPSTASAEIEPKQIVVARVNGVPLFMDALVAMMNRLPNKSSNGTPESLEEHKQKSLDKLVLQELAYQQAKERGISIGSDKVDMAIRNLKENLGGEKEYTDYLVKQKVTEADLRAQVERSLTIELLYAKEVLAKVTVPEDEVRQEYEKTKNLYITPEKASIIDVYVLKNGDGKASSKKAKELLRTITADANKDPWKLTLDGTFIVRDINVNKDMEKELFEAAKSLKPNQLSGVIETPTGSHIIKLEKYSPERHLTFDEVKNKLELKFKVPAQEKRTREWEQELKQNAKIEIMPDIDR